MSEKKSTSVSLKKEHLARMDEDNVNRSALINDLLDEYYANGGNTPNAVSEYRLQELNYKERSVKAELDAIKEEKERVRAMNENAEQKAEATIEEAADKLRGTELSASNPAIEKWAAECGITEQELIDELKERRDT